MVYVCIISFTTLIEVFQVSLAINGSILHIFSYNLYLELLILLLLLLAVPMYYLLEIRATMLETTLKCSQLTKHPPMFHTYYIQIVTQELDNI